MEKEITPDGLEIVYISDQTFDAIEKAYTSVAHMPPNDSPYPMISLIDLPARIEFRRLSQKGER